MSIRAQGLGLSPNSYLIAAILTVGMIMVWGWGKYAEPILEHLAFAQQSFSTFYYFVVFAIVIINLEVKSQFIYFQF